MEEEIKDGVIREEARTEVSVRNIGKKPIGIVEILGIIAALLLVCAVLLTVICVKQPSKKSSVLIVDFVSSSESTSTDTIQLKNALKNGGRIVIKLTSSFLDDVIPQAESYGASNINGTYYTLGSVVNYISHLGWKLVSVDSTYGFVFMK